MDWFYSKGGVTVGPVAREAVLVALDSGELSPSDFVWPPGVGAWQPATAAYEELSMPRPIPVPPGSVGYGGTDDRLIRALLPVGRSGWAIASGYLALGAMIPFFGIAAIITGILGIRAIKAREGLHGMGRAVFGIVVGTAATLMWVLILLLM